MSQDDPYAAIAAPLAASDPYSGVGVEDTSAPLHTFSTKAKNGKTISFQAPADADDATIRELAAKATGSKAYLRSDVKRDGTPLPAGDHSALNALALGVLKPIDAAAGLLDKIPGLHEASDAIGRATGLGTAAETNAQHNAERANNDRTGYQTLGNIAGVAPLSMIPGATTFNGLALTGAAGGALLSDASDARGVAGDAGLGAVGNVIGGKIVAPALAAAGRGIMRGAQAVAQPLGALMRGAPAGAGPVAAPPASSRYLPIVLKSLAAQPGGVEGSLSRVADARARGVPLAIMDSGDEARGLASALGRSPGDARGIIRGAVLPRQDAQIDRVQSAITSNLGPVANVRQQSEALMAGAKTAAGPLYDAAYASPAASSPRLANLLDTPAGRSAIARARTIAANEERDPNALGFALDADGNVKLNPVPVEQIGDASGARAELDAAQEAYRASRTGPGDTAKARARVEAARGAVRASEKALAAAPTTGVASTEPVYSPQTLDYVKRGLDDVVEQYRDKTTGRLVLDEAGRAINGVRHNFVSEVDKLNPAYAQARAAYAGPARMTTALQKGATVGNKDSETIAAETADLSGPELEQYKLGVRSALSKMLEGRVDGSDKVKALVGSPKKRAVLAQLFGGEEKFGQFMSTLSDEGEAAATYGRVNTGSSTAANLADDGHIGGLTGVAANAGERALRGTGIVHNAISTLADLYRYGAGEAGARARADLARTISNMDPNELEAFKQAAEQFQATRLRDVGRTNATRRLVAPASTALSPRPGQ